MKQRKDGRYCINVYLGKVDGKPKYKSVMGKTPAEVNKKAAELRVKYNKGVSVLSGDNKKLSFWIDAYLKKVERSAAPEWYKIVNSRLQVWRRELGDFDVEKINTYDLECVLADIAERNPYCNKPTSAKTLAEYKHIIVRIFDFCAQNRVLTFNPSNYIELPKALKKGKREPLTDKEIETIKNTPHLMQLPAMLMLFAGLRKGEVIALNWSDIDLEKNTISVNKAANLKQGGVIKSPKTEAGNRTVPMPKVLSDYLKGIKKEGLLVLTLNGKPFDNHSWEWEWDKYMRKCGIETTAHCLRHTYCTLLYESGIDVLTAKVYMGHSDIQTTLGIYTHLRKEKEQGTVEKLDAYLSPSADVAESY